MDFTLYLFVLIVLAERGARAENKEHGSITDRGVALDESSMKLEELSFAESPTKSFLTKRMGGSLVMSAAATAAHGSSAALGAARSAAAAWAPAPALDMLAFAPSRAGAPAPTLRRHLRRHLRRPLRLCSARARARCPR